MSKLLLNLRMVLEDEADDVRAMLEAHRIEFYETRPSRWGVSHGGIWVTHEQDVAQARKLMADYQSQRRERARTERPKAIKGKTMNGMARSARPERPGLV